MGADRRLIFHNKYHNPIYREPLYPYINKRRNRIFTAPNANRNCPKDASPRNPKGDRPSLLLFTRIPGCSGSHRGFIYLGSASSDCHLPIECSRPHSRFPNIPCPQLKKWRPKSKHQSPEPIPVCDFQRNQKQFDLHYLFQSALQARPLGC